MPETNQGRKLSKDPPDNQHDVETTSSVDENRCLSVNYFEDISSETENRMSKQLRSHREILRL